MACLNLGHPIIMKSVVHFSLSKATIFLRNFKKPSFQQELLEIPTISWDQLKSIFALLEEINFCLVVVLGFLFAFLLFQHQTNFSCTE